MKDGCPPYLAVREGDHGGRLRGNLPYSLIARVAAGPDRFRPFTEPDARSSHSGPQRMPVKRFKWRSTIANVRRTFWYAATGTNSIPCWSSRWGQPIVTELTATMGKLSGGCRQPNEREVGYVVMIGKAMTEAVPLGDVRHLPLTSIKTLGDHRRQSACALC